MTTAHKALIAVAIVLAVLLLGWFGCSQSTANADNHRVTFAMNTPGYNGEATAIPVQITGTTAEGREYDKLVFLDGGGNGVVLTPGTYELSFPGGSILANGTVLLAPEDEKLEVEVPEGLARNQFVQLELEEPIAYTAVAPLDATEEVLDTVYKVAVQNPDDRGRASELREHAKEVHEEALTKQQKDSAALIKEATRALDAATGDTVEFVGTLRVLTAEELSEELEDENILWNFYDRTLAVLELDKTRDVTMQPDAGSSYYYGGSPEPDEYEVERLLLNTDMTGIYNEADDGTLAAYDGKHILVSGKISRTADWASSLIAPVSIANPDIEEVKQVEDDAKKDEKAAEDDAKESEKSEGESESEDGETAEGEGEAVDGEDAEASAAE